MDSIAHIKKEENSQFKFHSLLEHLSGTADLVAKFASAFNNPEWGRLLGLWHDIGKFSRDFQDYIMINSGYQEDDQIKPKVDHTSSGAILAKEILPSYWPPLSYCIAGHHAGLHNWFPVKGISGDLTNRLTKQSLLEDIRGSLPKEIFDFKDLNPPANRQLPPEHIHLWIRMLFSCLVDADYLDTERFMNPESFSKRGKYDSISELNLFFEDFVSALSKNAPNTHLNNFRNKILKECKESGAKEPGFFSITVPTGGGKTISSMAWALEHAIRYNKSRIVFAIPYTSIIAQTAQVYRDIFGADNVIEHHSNIDEKPEMQNRKLATENWDAPIIVTTNVQLFESLFSNKASKCRKLHNLANSIIILDEAQMLPPEFLKPILSVLCGLVNYFGVSVLFSTATQPALTGNIGGSGQNAFTGIDRASIYEIVKDSRKLAHELKRVKIEMPEDVNQPFEYKDIAEELQKYNQVLCIMNTRKDCRDLYNLMPKGTLHLSRMMCSAHIMDTIERIKEHLRLNIPVRVISTQLIEAGVDIDFPVVYRALAGLDSIAQSAGRCNREGKLNHEGKIGLTKLFCPPKPIPPGLMRKGADTMKEIMHNDTDQDFLNPELFEKYFSLFYSKIQDFDKPKVNQHLCKNAREMKFQFATASRDFRLIDDKRDQNIIVKYGKGESLIKILKARGPESWLMRKLQRYTVSVKEHDFAEILKAELIEQIHGCWVQRGEALYSQEVGLLVNGEWSEEIYII